MPGAAASGRWGRSPRETLTFDNFDRTVVECLGIIAAAARDPGVGTEQVDLAEDPRLAWHPSASAFADLHAEAAAARLTRHLRRSRLTLPAART